MNLVDWIELRVEALRLENAIRKIPNHRLAKTCPDCAAPITDQAQRCSPCASRAFWGSQEGVAMRETLRANGRARYEHEREQAAKAARWRG